MTQVILNISNKKKWNALKTVLEAMDIEYITPDAAPLSEKELGLLRAAEDDKKHGRLTAYTNHRDILGRQ